MYRLIRGFQGWNAALTVSGYRRQSARGPVDATIYDVIFYAADEAQ